MREKNEELSSLILEELEKIFKDCPEEFNMFWLYPHKFWCNTLSPKQAMKDNPRSLLFLLHNYKFYSEE